MPIQPVKTADAPAPVGPYSQAMRAGDWIHTAGQIPLDPTDGHMVKQPIEDAARRVLDNLQAVLHAAGATLQQVVSVTIYVADINDFAAINAVYADYFDAGKPARSLIQAAALPKGAPLEISAIAYVGP